MAYNQQAFPVPPAQIFPSGDITYAEEGMTLRDYFAGQALAGILANCFSDTTAEQMHDVAPMAYKFADALIAERKV